RDGKASPVIKVGDLSPVRDFSHVQDVVEAYRLLLSKGEPGQAYNVCSGQGRSIGSLLEEMLQLSGVPARIEREQARVRPSELPSLVGDASKVRRLGWKPLRSATDALREALSGADASSGWPA